RGPVTSASYSIPVRLSAAGAPATPSDDAGWVQVLAQLYARRAAALTAADPAALAGAFAPGSPLLEADAAWSTALSAAGQQLEGFAPDVLSVSDAVPVPGGVRLRVVDRVPGYVLVSATGAQQMAGRGDRAVSLTLVPGESGWRISAAEALP
ncbi:serine/threonine protein kinase, partial [Klenkia sp. PcliD-1-E]|nr:serine/threonine protein kinase [Klenkia sp. PcliD-1-E]